MELPLSEWGSPSVTYIDASELGKHKQDLAALADSGKDIENNISADDLKTLISSITGAIENGLGIYVFYSE